MRNVVGGLCTLLLLWGCSMQHGEQALFTQYEKSKYYHGQLLKTEKIRLPEQGETAILLSATYLSYKKESDHLPRAERFIVSIYADDEMSMRELVAKGLRLEGIPPVSVNVLHEDDPRLAHISFKTPWNHFFLVSFPPVEKERFDLTFHSTRYGTGVMHFAKRAKYTFTPKVF